MQIYSLLKILNWVIIVNIQGLLQMKWHSEMSFQFRPAYFTEASVIFQQKRLIYFDTGHAHVELKIYLCVIACVRY